MPAVASPVLSPISITDRYLAISRPLLYVPVRTNSLVLCWILAVNLLSGEWWPLIDQGWNSLCPHLVFVSAPVFFAWSDSQHHTDLFTGADEVCPALLSNHNKSDIWQRFSFFENSWQGIRVGSDPVIGKGIFLKPVFNKETERQIEDANQSCRNFIKFWHEW